jgi:uncharacterized protein
MGEDSVGDPIRRSAGQMRGFSRFPASDSFGTGLTPLRPWLAAVTLLVLASAAGAQLAIPPPPTRRVNDYAEALSPADRDRLERTLIERERGSSNQVVVAIFRSLRGESLEDYAIRLAQAWRVGQKGLDNGVIFLVFLDERRMRLEVGYGLEDRLTDAQAGSIIRDVVAPRFREGKVADGIAAGVDAITAAIAGTYAAPAGKRAGRPDPLLLIGLGIMLLVGVPLLLVALNEARRRAHGLTGGPGGWTTSGGHSGWSGPWGGSGSSWGGSGSSSDSFGGGGGTFGGGGASGEW